jgi:hypothetical protein
MTTDLGRLDKFPQSRDTAPAARSDQRRAGQVLPIALEYRTDTYRAELDADKRHLDLWMQSVCARKWLRSAVRAAHFIGVFVVSCVPDPYLISRHCVQQEHSYKISSTVLAQRENANQRFHLGGWAERVSVATQKKSIRGHNIVTSQQYGT